MYTSFTHKHTYIDTYINKIRLKCLKESHTDGFSGSPFAHNFPAAEYHVVYNSVGAAADVGTAADEVGEAVSLRAGVKVVS